MKDKLNIFEIEKVVNDIRAALHLEKQMLLEDIEFLQNCIDTEIEFAKEFVV